MILDERTEFADGVAITGAAATRQVGDVIDTTIARDLGQGQPIYLYILVDTAATGADSIEFKLVSDSVNPPAVDGTATEHWSSGVVAIADAPAGTRYMFALPLEDPDYERYLALHVANLGASALAALVVSAGLTLDPAGWKSYPDAVN